MTMDIWSLSLGKLLNKGVKMKQKKVNLGLYVKPADAIKILEWAYKQGMITASMYAGKGQRIVAEFDLVIKTVNKN